MSAAVDEAKRPREWWLVLSEMLLEPKCAPNELAAELYARWMLGEVVHVREVIPEQP